MKTLNHIFGIGLLFYFLSSAGLLQAQWSVAYLSEARERATPIVVDHFALFVTGTTDTGGSNKVDMYDANTDIWTVHELPYVAENYSQSPWVAALGGKVFFYNGDAITSEIQVFEPALNQWTELTLSEARGLISIGVAGDYVVFAGGAIGQDVLSSTIDLYHVPSGTWHVSQLSQPRAYIAITGWGNKVFLAGGYKSGWELSDRVDVLKTDDWTQTSHTLIEPRAFIEAVAVGDKVILAGGGVAADFNEFNEVDIYDGGTTTWSSESLVQYDYAGIMESAVVGNKVYFHGGFGPFIFDVYDAIAETWTVVDMPTQHALGAFTTDDSKLYLAGGVNDHNGVVEVYDCINNAWDTLGFLSEPRSFASGAVAGNKLLFAGGDASGSVSNVVDIYTGFSSGTLVPRKDNLLEPYPNPTSGMLYIPLPVDATILRVFDLQGKLIMTSAVDNIAVKEIFTGNLSPGFYLISVEGADRVYWAKFEVL